MANELENLKLERGQIKLQVKRFVKYLERLSSNPDVDEISARLEALQPDVLNSFNAIQNSIERLAGDGIDEHEREAFENGYYKLISRAKKLIKNNSSSLNSSNASLSNEIQGQVKLPHIQLPEFYGNYSQWTTFHDSFKSLIHDNTQLSNVQKFYYLKSCLKSEASQVIHSIEISNDNYDIAWSLLRERFENKKLIVHTHIKTLFDLNNVKIESHNYLRKLLDNFTKNLRALTSLGETTEILDALLIYIITSKFDPTTKREWEEKVNKTVFPKISDITEFLTQRCQILETIESKVKIQKPYSNSREEKTLAHVVTTKISCAFCSQNHYNYQCDKILKMSINDRFAEVKKHKLCTNCLRPNHTQQVCNSSLCRHCGKKHHSLLHQSYNDNFERSAHANHTLNNSNTETITPAQTSSSSTPINSNETNVVMHCLPQIKSTQVLLATAMINILDSNGKLVKCRALLDSGSQTNFMSRTLADKLHLKTQKIHIPIAGINNSLSHLSNKTETTILSLDERYKTKQGFLLVNKITENLPQTSFSASCLQIPSNIKLADENFCISKPIDVLLGASIFFEILCIGQIRSSDNKVVFQKTKLGWVVSGPVNSYTKPKNEIICNFAMSENIDIRDQIEKFWQLEECPTKSHHTIEELKCEENFITNYKRDTNGRFTVKLPFKENINNLGESQTQAINRFYNLEKKLGKNPKLKLEYCVFMQEYETLGHMTKINPLDTKNTNLIHYLPHHGVFKESSTTSKLRVVFDASARTDSGLSLNNTLMVGPVIQEDLFSIVLRFRKHNIVFTADIEKMYRQINVADADRDLQRVVWRADPTEELRHYRLNTVTYGTASASFLAIRSLHQAAKDNISNYPQASEVIMSDFYVDDLLTGAQSIEEAKLLKHQIVYILSNAAFPLRKFYSNIKELVDNCDSGDLGHYSISDDKTCKTLGLFWNPHDDILSYSVKFDSNNSVTKRQVLSIISKIFDPLGIIGPITIRAKLIMQRLWQHKLDWDESLPADLHTSWYSFYNHLPLINDIKLPRQVTIPHFVKIELHGFCDASEIAYGACIFIRTTHQNGTHTSKLLCAKSRVAPLKTVTLPRLELCGALLLAQLVRKAEQALGIQNLQKFYWCDSTIVLSWVEGEPCQWKTFVANRIAEIHQLTHKSRWRHINSVHNPADILSRGASPQQLQNSRLWWLGPEFLKMNEDCWPNSLKPTSNDIADIPERKRVIQLSFVNYLYTDQSIFERFSNLNKLIRVYAYVQRFIRNVKSKEPKDTGTLTRNELDRSLFTLIKMMQFQHFNLEIKDLSQGKYVSKTSKLYSLNPFIDKHGLLRVGGRITLSKVTPDQKHPILLPPNHALTKMIIESEHKRLLHSGPQTTLSAVRNKYWPIDGKNVTKGVLRKCITCFKARPSNSMPLMGSLPEARLTPGRPFSVVGVDFAGPVLIKDGKSRSRKIIKSYICIFICFKTKAVHLEVAGDLTSNCFLNILKRFVSRRGLCTDIYSDNGTNFVGTKKELGDIYTSICKSLEANEIKDFLSKNSINWHFSPPRAPHFGGLWEAAVKSAKYHLIRVIKDAHLTFEHLSTVLCQIEAVLNSRPLTPLSSDPSDLIPLTPSHFLIGDVLTAIPQLDVNDVPVNRLTLYQRTQQILQHFWKRWSSDYLNSLQQRSKWKTNRGQSYAIGSLVLLKEDNCPPQQWKLGRITAVYPGKDDLIRVVDIRTVSGTFRRSVAKVCVLPQDSV